MSKPRIKPVIVLPTGKMSREDIDVLRQDGVFCVVECENPDDVRFLEPPPADYSHAERAAIELCRQLLVSGRTINRNGYDIASMYVEVLTKGTALERPKPVQKATKKK